MYTHVSTILQCIGPCYLFRSFRSIFVYNSKTLKQYIYYLKCRTAYMYVSAAFCLRTNNMLDVHLLASIV